MITEAPLTHIRLDSSGVAWIDDTKVKVVEIISDHLAYGYSPEEIHLQHPHLSLAQVHAAFAYYFDHQEGMDAEMEQRLVRAQAARVSGGEVFRRADLVERLKQK